MLGNIKDDEARNWGLLFLRVGIGLMFMYHGYPKILGGIDKWAKIGKAMENFGISFFPTFWGFMASFAEFFGGLALVLGVLFQPTCFLLAVTMITSATHHLARGDSFGKASHAIEAAILFIALFFIGEGRYTIAKLFKKDS